MMKHDWVSEPALAVCKMLQQAGHQAVVVGGCVRDAFLGKIPHDWDIATSAMPEEVVAHFSKVILTGIKHGTVTVVCFSEPIEVTTFRSEGKYTDGRHPDEVKFGVTLEEDLSRRDFTMNALAFDPVSKRLHDPFDGASDIQNKVIRTVGHPQDRFGEDALRMMRAIRFMATLNMRIASETVNAIRDCRKALKSVSFERIRDELLKLLGAERPSEALRIAATTGLLWEFIPELYAAVKHPQNSHHQLDVWEHTLLTVDHSMRDPIHRVGALLHDVAKPTTAVETTLGEFSFHQHCQVGAEMAKKIVTRLKFSNNEKERIVGMVRYHMALFGYNKGIADKALRRMVMRTGNLLPDIVALTMADIIGKGTGEDPEARLIGLREHLWGIMTSIAAGSVAVSTNQLEINGNDVMRELNLKPSKAVGDALKALLEKVLDKPELNERETLLGMLNRLD